MQVYRPKKLAWTLAGCYCALSCLVYFGSLRSESHAWWPMFLFPLILPWSALHQFVIEPLLFHWISPNPATTPGSFYTLNDYLAGAFYIVVGTLWWWFLGYFFTNVRIASDGERPAAN